MVSQRSNTSTSRLLDQPQKNTSKNKTKKKKFNGTTIILTFIVIGGVGIAFIATQKDNYNIPDDIPKGCFAEKLVPEIFPSYKNFRSILLTDAGIIYKPFLKKRSNKSALATFLEKAKKMREGDDDDTQECLVCYGEYCKNPWDTVYPCKTGLNSENMHPVCLSDLYQFIIQENKPECPICRKPYNEDFCKDIKNICENKEIMKHLTTRKKHKIHFKKTPQG